MGRTTSYGLSLFRNGQNKVGSGILTIVMVKSHIDGKQAYCRHTPVWQVLINELADFAADVHSDRFGNGKADKAKFYAGAADIVANC